MIGKVPNNLHNFGLIKQDKAYVVLGTITMPNIGFCHC
jgi:hypothetical protein